eukprot:Gb_21825 [translate_table: standard]
MEDGLECLSTGEIVHIIKNKPLEFQSISLANLLAQLIRRSLLALQDEKAGSCKSENELSALYDEWLCTWLLGILTSTAVSTRALAGATYFLALSTAGGSKHADEFRSKLVNVRGIPKLVALLSYESVSVRFNALLAFGNLLRHCPTTHSEAVRLGTLRKLAFLFQEAQEEPQQNLCVDTFLCLCDSDLPGMFDELQRNGIVNHALNWIHCTTSERVCKKVIESINILLDKTSESRNGLLCLQLVQPLLSVVKTSAYDEIRLVALTALESACCKEDSGMQRTHFVCNGGVKILMQIVESKNIILLIQAIQMLALLAVLDEKARQEITGLSSCLQYLRNILHSPNSEYEAFLAVSGKKDNEETELVPLMKEHVTAIRILSKVCSVSIQAQQEHHPCSPKIIAAPGIMAARVGAE